MAQISKAQCIELVTAPGFFLERDAARAWDRSVLAFGKTVILTGAWRSLQIQVELFDSELHPRTGRYVRGNRAGQRGFTTDVRGRLANGELYRGSWWTRKAGTAAAAVPGTSNHGAGLSTDVATSRRPGDPGRDVAVVFTAFTDPDRLQFLRVAAEHGWYDTEGRSVGELWHLTYYPARDQHRGQAPTKGFLMALTDKEQKELLDSVRELRAGTAPGVNMPWKDDNGKQAKYTLRSALAWIASKLQ
jgi:hypothetical protein